MSLILPSIGAFGHTSGGSIPDEGGGSLTTSDTFEAQALNTSLWTVSNTPTGTSITFDYDATDAWIDIATTDSNSHDSYGNLSNVPYIFQALPAGDFDFRIKCMTTPTQQYEGFGFILKEDGEDYRYLRADLNSNGTDYFAFCSERWNSTTGVTTKFNVSSLSYYPYLRINRIGVNLRFYTSSDNSTYTQRGLFTLSQIVPDLIGICAISSDSSDGYSAKIDWFEDYTNDPLSGEN